MYSEPHRQYNNLHHIADCLGEFDCARQLAREPVAVESAIRPRLVIRMPTTASASAKQVYRVATQFFIGRLLRSLIVAGNVGPRKRTENSDCVSESCTIWPPDFSALVWSSRIRNLRGEAGLVSSSNPVDQLDPFQRDLQVVAGMFVFRVHVAQRLCQVWWFHFLFFRFVVVG